MYEHRLQNVTKKLNKRLQAAVWIANVFTLWYQFKKFLRKLKLNLGLLNHFCAHFFGASKNSFCTIFATYLQKKICPEDLYSLTEHCKSLVSYVLYYDLNEQPQSKVFSVHECRVNMTHSTSEWAMHVYISLVVDLSMVQSTASNEITPCFVINWIEKAAVSFK